MHYHIHGLSVSRIGQYSLRYSAPALLFVLALAIRLPLLSSSIAEVDAANFVNALTNGYNIPLMRPHPPGYPIYLFMGWLADGFVDNPRLSGLRESRPAGRCLSHQFGLGRTGGRLPLSSRPLVLPLPRVLPSDGLPGSGTPRSLPLICCSSSAFQFALYLSLFHGRLPGVCFGIRFSVRSCSSPLWLLASPAC